MWAICVRILGIGVGTSFTDTVKSNSVQECCIAQHFFCVLFLVTFDIQMFIECKFEKFCVFLWKVL